LPDSAELAQRPSPADRLRREDIPADLFQQAASAAGGTAPAELAAVLPHGGQHTVAVAISPDGQFLASGGGDHIAKIWDLATGKLLHTLEHPSPPIYDVAFVPARGTDGKPELLLVTANPSTRTARLWDVQTGALRFTLTGHSGDLRHVVGSPDGRWVATADDTGTIHIWDPTTGKRLRTLHTPFLEWGDLGVSADGRILATAAQDGVIRLWDPHSGWLLATLVGHQGPGRAIAFLSDGRSLASSGNIDGTVRVWDLTTLRQKKELPIANSQTVRLCWRADGHMLVADDYRHGKVRLWNLNADSPRFQAISLFAPGGNGGIHGLAMTPEGRYVTTANPGGTVYVLRLAEPGEVLQLAPELAARIDWPAHDRSVTSVSFADDGKTLITASKDGFIKFWNCDRTHVDEHKQPGAPALRQSLPTQEDGVRVMARTADGKTLATAGFDGIIRLWDAQGNQLHELTSHPGGTLALLFDNKGTRLLSGGSDGKVCLWNVKDGKQLDQFGASRQGINHLSLSPDGRFLATSDNDAIVRIWDMDKRGKTTSAVKPQRVLRDRTGAWFSPAGALLATTTRTGTIELLDPTTGQTRLILHGHRETPAGLSFAADGQRLAATGKDGGVRVWDTSTGQLLAILRGHQGQLCAPAFAADGKMVSAGDEDGKMLLWNVPPPEGGRTAKVSR
jgi:WD40 repeat protein